MRVTNIGRTTAIITQVERAARDVADATARAQSGLRVARPSDDPHHANSILRLDADLRAIEQYRRNAGRAASRLSAEEGVLTQLSDALARARQLGIQEASATGNAQTRLVAKAEVDQLLAFAVQLANTRHAGEYLFGGDQPAAAPITLATPPFAAVPVTGGRAMDIGEPTPFATNHNATEVFLDTGVLAALEELSAALGNDDPAAITTALSSLDSAHGAVQGLVGDLGARIQHLEAVAANLATLDGTVRIERSDIAEVDFERAISDLMARQQTYQAALLVTARILELSLANFLR